MAKLPGTKPTALTLQTIRHGKRRMRRREIEARMESLTEDDRPDSPQCAMFSYGR
ncbi:MAG: hypothetical protein R3C54_05790 [Parvularculaceae bacterium]